MEVWNRLKITRARDFGSLAGWLPASPVSANEERVLRKLPEKASTTYRRGGSSSSIYQFHTCGAHHTRARRTPSPPPFALHSLPTPAGDGHGRRLYVAPPAVGIAASPGGYTLHPEHPDFSPHRTRVSSSSASSNHPCLYLAESAASVVLGDPGAARRGECIPRGAAEAVRVLSLSLLVVKFTCAHLCGCFWIRNYALVWVLLD